MEDRIIAATDGSDHGTRAVAFAIELALGLGRGLSLVHVDMHARPSMEMTRLAEAEHLLDRLSQAETLGGFAAGASIRQLYDDSRDEIERIRISRAIGQEILERARLAAEDAGVMDVRAVHSSGDYADEILDAAESEGAEIIVLGRRGLGRFREFLVGSVTQKVLHMTDKSVVVVR